MTRARTITPKEPAPSAEAVFATAALLPLAKIRDGYVTGVGGAAGRLATALYATLLVALLLTARVGTLSARLLAAASLAVGLALSIGVVAWVRRRFQKPADVIRVLARREDPEKTGRALRALSLLSSSGEGTSRELAQLHVARVMAALPVAGAVASSRRAGARLRAASLAVLLVALGLVAFEPWGVFEGADVLLARGGEAPFAMDWLGEVAVRVRPPEYVHETERAIEAYAAADLPNGTLVTFTGRPLHRGRRLLLTDGTREIPFVDDGQGGMVARFPVSQSSDLRVVARMGDVTIPEPLATPIKDVADRAPVVTLEGAPKEIHLAKDPSDIPLRYAAEDDYGLREVHLVLRTGTREDRRVLARLDGETKTDRGGHVLKASDPFIKKSHAPIEVRIEAKDNDPLTGPKWGASPAFTLVPPDVGEPEAERVDALRKLRDALVDALAERIDQPLPTQAAERKALAIREQERADDNAARFDATMAGSYAGMRVPSRLGALLRARMQKLREAVDAEVSHPSASTQKGAVKATERMVLATDGAIRGLGVRGAKDIAKDLVDVADDLVLGLDQRQHEGETERGKAKGEAATTVLAGGGKSLRRLGNLGRDLGEIVDMDLSRVGRASGLGDLIHAELAARDLAARLRQPDPSFGSKGGSRTGTGEGGAGSGEGEPSGGSGGEGEADGEQAFNEAARDLEALAVDHAAEIGKVEQALAGNTNEDDMKEMREEAKRHADTVRESVKALPAVGGGSDSWTSKAAAAKEHAERMAHALETANPADAVESGRSALQELDDAKRDARAERWGSLFGADPMQRIDEARRKLDPEVRWAEERLSEMRKRAGERAASELGKAAGEEEDLAERARKIGGKGREQGNLPAPALDALDRAERAAKDAAKELRRGEADKALERQKEAQRALEMAKQSLGDDEGESPAGRGETEGRPTDTGYAGIPKADEHKGPEEFRRRVLKGFGQPGGRHEAAASRYVEGLLR